MVHLSYRGEPVVNAQVAVVPSPRYGRSDPSTGYDRPLAGGGREIHTGAWPGVEFTGKISDLGTGSWQPDAPVSREDMWRTLAATAARVATSDAKGVARFPHVPVGTYWIRVGSEGLNVAPRDDDSVQVDPGTRQRVDVSLLPVDLVSGQCLDESGRPVAGEWIQPRLVSGHRVLSPTRTGADGRFYVWTEGDEHVDLRFLCPRGFLHPRQVVPFGDPHPVWFEDVTLHDLSPADGFQTVRLRKLPSVRIRLRCQEQFQRVSVRPFGHADRFGAPTKTNVLTTGFSDYEFQSSSPLDRGEISVPGGKGAGYVLIYTAATGPAIVGLPTSGTVDVDLTRGRTVSGTIERAKQGPQGADSGSSRFGSQSGRGTTTQGRTVRVDVQVRIEAKVGKLTFRILDDFLRDTHSFRFPLLPSAPLRIEFRSSGKLIAPPLEIPAGGGDADHLRVTRLSGK